MGKIVDGVYYGASGKPVHRGIVEVDGKIYYAGHNGVLAKNETKTIHHGMANGLVEHGDYYFDNDGVIDKTSFKVVKKSEKKGKKTDKTKNAKKDKTVVFVLCVVFCAVLIVFVSQSFSGWFSEMVQNNIKRYTVTESPELSVSVMNYSKDVYLCTQAVERYYQGEYALSTIAAAGSAAYKPFTFEYDIKNAESATLELSRSEDFSDSKVFELDVNDGSLDIDNLYVDTVYYYRVTAKADGVDPLTKKGSFKTADTSRFLSFSGVYNTRDIGGYYTMYGKKIKQGLLIRGTEMDGLVQSSYFLKDVSETKEFGFVYDMDLRSSNVFGAAYLSPLGSKVGHAFYDSPQYAGIFTKNGAESVKQIFTALADESNYPMYLHCTHGADRTGTVVFLLQGLLGVSEEDMMTEYKLTGFFSQGYASGEGLNPLIMGLQGFEGNSINQKIENYLIDYAGITIEQINQIRAILLENEQ